MELNKRILPQFFATGCNRKQRNNTPWGWTKYIEKIVPYIWLELGATKAIRIHSPMDKIGLTLTSVGSWNMYQTGR